jgi:hypothetical protein
MDFRRRKRLNLAEMADAQELQAESRRRQALDEELVPLVVAATVAYFHVTEAAHQVTTQSDLAEVVPLVAIALSTVAPIVGEEGPLGAAQLRERLYGRPPALDGLKMRRGDLRAAMITLREARASFAPAR